MVREKIYFCVCDVDDEGHTKMYNNMEDYDQGRRYFRDQWNNMDFVLDEDNWGACLDIIEKNKQSKQVDKLPSPGTLEKQEIREKPGNAVFKNLK